MSRRDAIKQMLQGFRGDNNVPDSLLDEKDASGVSIAQLTREQYVGYGKQYILDLWTGYYGHATDNQVADDKWPAGAIEAGKTLRANP